VYKRRAERYDGRVTKGFAMDDGTSSFELGAGVMIETEDGGVEVGDLVGASMFGIIFRATHRLTTEELSDEEAEAALESQGLELLEGEDAARVTVTETRLKPLTRSVLTMLPWSFVKRIELAEEYIQEGTLSEFKDALELDDGIPAEFGLDEALSDTLADPDDEDDDPGPDATE
jgi:hypothetical protein